ncbi:MAG: c-type cytochrome [Chlamydiales bacterium]|nr:c-type cytochrome [Chlamydiia bacterium]MCP5507462.1 c-type cytochrome [Chlamydiales bacterium]
MRGNTYQYVLIATGVVATALFGVFLYRELFPEYKIYQNDYIALEEFRSTYTGQPVPPFKTGVKQIVMEQEDKGPASIDRCTSCHVALKFEHFSPTKIAYDVNGNMELDADGFPVKVPNENDVWAKLDQAIASLRDKTTNEELENEGRSSEVRKRLNQAEEYESLKTAHVDGHTYDVTKVLRMHPLMGRETRPFEYHPIEEYGCTSCHNGNGRGLTTEKAHGPVFDGHYETETHGETPIFIESDPENDPKFAKVFNHKPGHSLLFQTTPIYVGALMEAKCVQCHKTGPDTLKSAYEEANVAASRREAKRDAVMKALKTEKQAVATLLSLKLMIREKGTEKTLQDLEKQSQDYTKPPEELDALNAQISFVRKNSSGGDKTVLRKINGSLVNAIGSKELVAELQNQYRIAPTMETIQTFITNNSNATGSLFQKAAAANLERALIQHVRDAEQSLHSTVQDPNALNAIQSDIDKLTGTYQEGRNLYISQACYACHRIAGFARGGIGPELTREGLKYPWFIKESIVWPQADLKTSTMPNLRLDPQEQEALMTFLLGQTGHRKNESEAGHKIAIQEWEAGKKLPWEQQVPPAKLHDLDYSMTVFATQGCAACHRLKGFESNVGFAIEKGNKPSFDALYDQEQWFEKLFPEEVPGSTIVKTLENHQEEIDSRIVDDVRENALLERIEAEYPYAVESLYSNFRYAARAKNSEYQGEKLKQWKERVKRVMMMYVQQYGLGRLIGPRPNWAGVYRTDEWLIEHFKNPTSHVPRSIMPVFPFDESKFYALTYMLDVLGVRNRNAVQEIWTNNGFSPEKAYEIFCSQCHGEFMQGNGPVSEWIYPVPKNLQNADFMRNLTRERVIESITHGVKGTPMPPWGEAPVKPTDDGIPVISKEDIKLLTDWLFTMLPGGMVIRKAEDVPKWQYGPEDAIKELQLEGGELDAEHDFETPKEEKKQDKALAPELTALPTGDNIYVDLEPKVSNLNSNVTKYFDVVKPPVEGGADEYGYYIKKKYYTPQNLEEGKRYFELNCASCHGRDADGAGNRATAMVDAKPRMLTNIDWIKTRDDLRWLRSIKYGVPGTAMQAWGDQTSSKQRMQLVMYIRTLSEEAEERDALYGALYKAFNTAILAVDSARVAEAPQIVAIMDKLEKAKQSQAALQSQAKAGLASTDEAVQAYQKFLELNAQFNEAEVVDNTLNQLSETIVKERDLYEEIGLAMLAQKINGISLTPFLKMVKAEEGRFTFVDGVLTLKEDGKAEEERKKILDTIDKNIEALKQKRTHIQGRIASPERTEELKDLNISIGGLDKLKRKVVSNLEAAKRLRTKEQELYTRYQERKSGNHSNATNNL